MGIVTHGLTYYSPGKRTRLFRIWTGIKTRCFNKNDHAYPKYGGRGITLCEEWLNFKSFHDWAISNGYTDELTIERVDVDKSYYPENCKWITRGEQARNRTNTQYATFNGETKTLKEWSEISGIDYPIIHNRFRSLGWSIEKTLTQPIQKKIRKTEV